MNLDFHHEGDLVHGKSDKPIPGGIKGLLLIHNKTLINRNHIFLLLAIKTKKPAEAGFSVWLGIEDSNPQRVLIIRLIAISYAASNRSCVATV